MATTDLTEALVEYLRDHADCTGLRNLVVNAGGGGWDNVLEAGELTEELLNDAVDARRKDPTQKNRVLAIAIQDDGEEPQNYHDARQYVVIRIYDRGNGYHNIREVRRYLKNLLRGTPFQFANGTGIGLKGIQFSVRTGHRWDRTFNIEYESIRWIGRVYYADSQME